MSKSVEQCECGRGAITAYISITKADGELLDRVGICRMCLRETAVERALDALGLKA